MAVVASEALCQHAKEELKVIRSSAVQPSTAVGAKNMVVTKGKRKSVGESDKPAKVKKLEDDIPDISLSCVDEIPFPTPNKKGKRKREIEESDKSTEVKKPIVDVSKWRPEIDVVEKIGVGVTAEAQSLFDALSKTQPAKVEEPIPGVKVNKAKEKTPETKPKKNNK